MEENKRSRGRPREVYKHISPLSKKPIPATKFYQEKKLLSRMKEQSQEKQLFSGITDKNERVITLLLKLRSIINESLANEFKIQAIPIENR